MVKDELGFVAPARQAAGYSRGMKAAIHSFGKRRGRPSSPMIAASTRAVDQHLVAALQLLRHDDAGAGNLLGARVDGQDVVHARRA